MRKAAGASVTVRDVLLLRGIGAILIVPALVALFAMVQRDTASD